MAERLPRRRPGLDKITESLTSDQPVNRPRTVAAAASSPPTSVAEWDARFASFLERVMAQAAIGGDPKPLQKELDALLAEAPPGKREELENNRGKPPSPAKS